MIELTVTEARLEPAGQLVAVACKDESGQIIRLLVPIDDALRWPGEIARMKIEASGH